MLSFLLRGRQCGDDPGSVVVDGGQFPFELIAYRPGVIQLCLKAHGTLLDCDETSIVFPLPRDSFCLPVVDFDIERAPTPVELGAERVELCGAQSPFVGDRKLSDGCLIGPIVKVPAGKPDKCILKQLQGPGFEKVTLVVRTPTHAIIARRRPRRPYRLFVHSGADPP